MTWQRVEKYAWRGYVSRELARRHHSEVEEMLQQQLEASVQREGYVPMPNTFSLRLLDHRDPENPPWWFSDEDRELLDRSDALLAMTSINCYKSDTPSP